MRSLLFAVVLLVPGCRPITESDALHILHPGEAGVIKHQQDEWVYGATDKSKVHELARAVETRDEAKLEQLMRSGGVMRIHADTRVKVVQESFNERLVRIEEGGEKGTMIWVPYEWLKGR